MEKFRSIQEDAFGRHKVSQPFTLFDAHNRYQLSDKFSNIAGNGGTVTYSLAESSALMNITTTPFSNVVRESTTVTPYQPGKSLTILLSFVMAASQTNLVQRAGYFGTQNGIFLEVSDKVYIVKRNNGTDTRIDQSSWNMNSLVGVLDMTKAQIFWVDIEWLGVGRVRCGFIIGGVQIPCHTFYHSNFTTAVYMTTATLPVRFEIYNTGALQSGATMKQICASVVSEGGYQIKTNIFSQARTQTLGAAGTYPSISLRLASSYIDAFAILNGIEIMITSNDVLTWQIVKNAVLTGAQWVSHSQSKLVEVDVNATAVNINGSKVIAQGFAYQRQSTSSDVSDYNQQLSRTLASNVSSTADTFTLVFTSTSQSVPVMALMKWNEF